MQCPKCGHDNRNGANFCSKCRTPLTAAQTRLSLQPGQLMKNGDYRIVRPLSQGGMGALYLVEDLSIFRRQRVIKEMLDYVDPTEYRTPAEYQQAVQRAYQRFEQEARTLARLHHSSIPDVVDFFSEGGRNYIVMEYVEGQNLLSGLTHEDAQRNIVHGQPYPVEDVVRWGIQACKILEYLAAQSPPVVHQDIKPANLVLDKANRDIHLVDFGTAQARIQVGSQSGLHKPSIYGTPGYAPAEQYAGKATPKSDVYALAATLYHLLTDDDPGDHPFDFPKLDQLDDALADILAQALEYEENKRPDAAQFRQALEQWLQSPHKKTTPTGTGNFCVVLPAVPDAAVKATSRALVQLLQVPEQQAIMWACAAPRVVFKTRSRRDATQVTGKLKTAGITARIVQVDESLSASLSAAQKQQLTRQGYVAGLTMARLGADKRCKCYRCGYEWTSRKKTGELPPAFCPKCKSSEWSRHRLFKCSICGHEFSHGNQSRPPTALFPTCPACGAADWLPGQSPILHLKAKKLDLGAVRVGEAKSAVLNIVNAGQGRLCGIVRCLAPWLRVEQPFSDSGRIALPLDTGQLVAGQRYRARVDVISSGGTDGVEVELIAQIPERIRVTPTTLDFGPVGARSPATRVLQIANVGGGALEGTATADQSWIQLSTTRLKGNRLSLTVSIKPDEMSGGRPLSGTIRIQTNGGVMSVPVRAMPLSTTLTCTPPVLQLMDVPPRGKHRRVVRLVNNGAGTLQGRVVSAPDWLRVEPTEWQGNDVNLTVEVEGRRLTEGQEYAGDIRLSSNGGEAKLPVQVRVQGPTLGVSPSTLDFGSLPVGWREKRRLQLTNLGLGRLQGTAHTTAPWLQVRPARFSGKNVRLGVSTQTRGLMPGDYRGAVEIDSNGGRTRVAVQVQLTPESSLPLAFKRYGLWLAAILGFLALLGGLVWGVAQIASSHESTRTPIAVVIRTTVTPTRPGQTPTVIGSPTVRPTSTLVEGTKPPDGIKTSTPIPTQATRSPTKGPPAPTATPPCPNPGVCITQPQSGAILRGEVQVQGTANISNFSYYKFEFRPEGVPTWSFLTSSHQAVTNGTLMTWNTTTVPSGNYRLRLVVVDRSGNYPEPCEIRVVIKQ